MKTSTAFAALLAALMSVPAYAQKSSPAEILLESARQKETLEGDLKGAIRQYEDIVKRHSGDRAVAAKALIRMAECYQKLGDDKAQSAYERIVREFADQKEAAAAEARTRLAAMSLRAREGEAAAMVTRRLWSGPEVSPAGSVAPDGRYLAFVHRDTGDLALRDLTTGQNRRLTNNGNWATDYAQGSTFSPDGKQIAYSWFTNTFYELRILPTSAPEGTRPRVLLSNGEFAYTQPCSWTPDGKYILAILSRKDRTNQIAMISVLDGSVRILKSLEWRYPDRASLSPDGRHIAYDVALKRDSADRDIYLLAPDGSREIPLVQHPAVDRAPVWTPDGHAVLFASDRTRGVGLWMIRVADGRPQGAPELVKTDMGVFDPEGIARDGSYYYTVGGVMMEIYTAELDTATGRITKPAAPASEPCLRSPDGQHLACPQGPAPGWGLVTLVVRSLKSGEQRQIPTKLTFPASVRWFPDGRSLLVVGGNFAAGLPVSLHRYDVRTGEDFIKRTIEAWFGSGAGVSPDGKKIYYPTYDGETRTGRIMVHEIETDTDSELYKNSPQRTRVALSRDGRQLAFVLIDETTRSTSLHIMPAEGGAAREVFRSRPGEPAGQFGIEWSQDGKHLLFAMAAEPGSKSIDLWQVSIDGGPPQPLGLGPGFERIGSPILDPDGRSIAFPAGRKRWEVWVLKNFLTSLRTAR